MSTLGVGNAGMDVKLIRKMILDAELNQRFRVDDLYAGLSRESSSILTAARKRSANSSKLQTG